MRYVQQLSNNFNKPFLFSYRRCPYAMRSRMALIASKIDFNIYEISLKDKPKEMLKLSSKGTVPVLVLETEILDESLEIMEWAARQVDSADFLKADKNIKIDINRLIKMNDNDFKEKLDNYKYNSKYNSNSNSSKDIRFKDCLFFIRLLEQKLEKTKYLLSNDLGYADIAIFPFVRQFANVDYYLFKNSGFTKTIKWLEKLVDSHLFRKIMIKPSF